MGSFFAQFAALCRKNWIVLWRHKWINIVRCLILPIAYAAFFSEAINFFTTAGVLGPGQIRPLQPIHSNLLGRKFVWSPPAEALTDPTIDDFVNNLVATAFEGVSAPVVRIDNPADLTQECPSNFAALSDCFAAVIFGTVDPSSQQLNYTILGDLGLIAVDTENPAKDDVSTRFLPVQWALESNFIALATGTVPASPLSWEYTTQTQEELDESQRLSYLRGIRSLIVLAFFLVFLGVVYQLPGSMASERATGLTSHLDAMGCRKSARVISWHLSVSSAYVVAWIVVAVIWQRAIFSGTNAGLFVILYILTGLSLASWTHLVCVPFASAPTLAAITSTFLAIILAVGALLTPSSAGAQIILTLLFPPMFYTFFTKALASYENIPLRPDILRTSPNGDAPVLALLVVAIIDIFLFPLLATWLETKVYGVRPPDQPGFLRRLFGKSGKVDHDVPEGTAVKVSNLRKLYSTRTLGFIGRSPPVTAIEDLSFEVPKGEIFCLLGRNGAAKSTTLGAIAKLLNFTAGQISYADDLKIGIATQKDVLWDELNCKQHVQLWRAIKSTKDHRQLESDLDLLARCDLAPKVKFLSQNLSGGQRRKLQLACALAGGSNLLLLDEISSGLDPLSRRAIWKLITANRGSSTIILTTHFLDEADYLGDHVAILQAPGKLLALDNPVGLKTRLGRGYTLAVDSADPSGGSKQNAELLEQLRRDSPDIRSKSAKGKELFLTGSTDLSLVRKLVDRMQLERRPGGGKEGLQYQVNGATLEEVFLDLNSESNTPETTSQVGHEGQEHAAVTPGWEKGVDGTDLESGAGAVESNGGTPIPVVPAISRNDNPPLTPGHKRSFLLSIPIDAFTIFRKRLLNLRRAWLLPLIGAIVVICGSCIPLFFMNGRNQTCANVARRASTQPLTWPQSPYPILYPPLVLAPASGEGDGVFGNVFSNPFLSAFVQTEPDNTSFVDLFTDDYRNQDFGGVSIASDPSSPSLFAWEGSNLLNKGLSSLNLISNAALNQISPSDTDPLRITLSYRPLPSPSFLSIAIAMKWLGFFGLAVGIWPAFATIYPTLEKAFNVRSNQYSNGASPAALWLGHLLFELPAIVLVSTIITIIFAVASDQFNYPGMVWICFVLYGISSTLYAYLFTLGLKSPLASWALVAGFNVILFLLYLASYLLILTYDKSANAADHITIVHFMGSLINPVPSIIRTILVSLNLFSLLCDGLGNYSSNPPSDILQFGGPILYFVLQSLIAYGLLVYIDSGSPIPAILRRKHKPKQGLSSSQEISQDVIDEKQRVDEGGVTDELQVRGLRKKYHGAPNVAVDDVSFGVQLGDTFALIGPNGAGKTTTLACIRGMERPNAGDIVVGGHSIIKARNQARSFLGVCPQVNAIDPNLTVGQHLWVYGKLKGVPSKPLKQDIDNLLAASGLSHKKDSLAISLSGGNQRKMALAIALIGDREVVLIDEFSSGVDPFSKREAWQTLAALTRDRAVVMTTHSMEEVDALASRVGIIASKMLAVGTPASLKSRFATYEIHLSADHVPAVLDYFHSHSFPSAKISMDTLTRISVSGVKEDDLPRLLDVLEGAKRELDLEQVTIQEASTETAFLEIVKQHNIQEEERHEGARPPWYKRLFAKKA